MQGLKKGEQGEGGGVGAGKGGGGWGWGLGGITDLQSSFDDAGLAVLDDLVQSLKVLVA